MAKPKLTHLDDAGAARMVDVAAKAPTLRRAVAEARVSIAPETLALLKQGAPKGDVIAVARIAGIQAAKKTSALIPLCHPLALTKVSVDPVIEESPPGVVITTVAECTGPTGVEMEALTAAGIAALTIYDMLKAVDRGMHFGVRLLEKEGGQSGHWRATEP